MPNSMPATTDTASAKASAEASSATSSPRGSALAEKLDQPIAPDAFVRDVRARERAPLDDGRRAALVLGEQRRELHAQLGVVRAVPVEERLTFLAWEAGAQVEQLAEP